MRVAARRVGEVLLLLTTVASGLAREQATDERLIRLQAVVFDPRADGEPAFEGLPDGPALRPEAGTAYRTYLIQLATPVTAGVLEALRVKGIDVLGYVPNRTLLVRFPQGAASVVPAAVPTRYVGRWLPGYKIASDLLARLRGGPLPGLGRASIDAYLFPGENPDALALAIAGRFAGSRILYVDREAPVRLSIEAEAAEIGPLVGSLIRDDAVQFVELRPALEQHNDQAAWVGQSYDRLEGPAEAVEPDPKPYAESATIWNRGITGAGQIVAVADTGLEYDACFFRDPAHPVTPQSVVPPGALALDAAHRKVLAVNAAVPGAFSVRGTFRHGTHVTSSVTGDGLAHLASATAAGHDHGDGMAPAAKLVFEDISAGLDSACNATIQVGSVQALLQQEYAAGARISTNSWGSSGGSGGAGVDAAVWQHEDLSVLFSAGNGGGAGIFGFASCKNCIVVGATENNDPDFQSPFGPLDPENMAAFSSRGPTSDGRLKPDVVAPGYQVASHRYPVEYVSQTSDPRCDHGDPDVCFPSFGGCFVTDSSQDCAVELLLGTSMSTPLAAGWTTLARQYFTDGFHPTGQALPAHSRLPSAALLKAVVLNGARNLTGRLYERRGTPVDLGPLADAPSPVQGWGGVKLDDVLFFPGDARRLIVADVANAAGIKTGRTVVIPFAVTSAGEPLEITLAWTDVPAQPGAGSALVNDLDLEVTAPGGTLYRGNQWTVDDPGVPGDKHSLPNPGGRDALNNVEGVLVPVPTAGPHTVTVRGFNVPGGQGLSTQGFGLAITGAVAPAVPPPVPDGTFGSPMTATRLDAQGTTIELGWDVASCLAGDYHVLHGPLAAVAALAPGGAECAIGTSGTHTWSGVPPGDLWFLLVADNGIGTEGSWGLASGGTQRNGATASGLCGMTARDNSGACP